MLPCKLFLHVQGWRKSKPQYSTHQGRIQKTVLGEGGILDLSRQRQRSQTPKGEVWGGYLPLHSRLGVWGSVVSSPSGAPAATLHNAILCNFMHVLVYFGI